MFFNFGGIPFMAGGAGGGPEMFFEDGGASFNAPPPNPDEDYYKTLGVDEKATEDELKKSYRKLSMLHHPDKNGNTDESKQKFQELNNAYETLSDGNKRRMYDMMRRGGGGGGHGMPGGGHPFEHVFHFGGGGMRPPNQQQHQQHQQHQPQFPPGIPEELLHMLFGQGLGGMGPGGHGQGPKVVFQTFNPGMRGGVPQHQPQHPPGMPPRFQTPPESIIKTVSLSLEQCFNGCTIPLEIDRQIPDNDIVKIEKETIHAQIPKGVLQGDTIILNECGHMNEYGMKGDIRIIVNILQHPVFKVEHLDLHIEKNIPLKLALCGFDFEIHHLNGKVFKLANKPGNVIKPGSIKTIPGLGLEKNGETGSLKIKFNVEFPDTLTSEQIQALSNGL
jgi:DnaJ-class molecular chaperone